MINSLRNFTIATLGAALASLGSITSAAAVDLSFSLSGLFEPNPAGYESFTGTFSFDPDDFEPTDAGILQTELSNYSITLFQPGGFLQYRVWIPEDFNSYIPSFVQFQRVGRSTIVSSLDFRRAVNRFNLSFSTNLTGTPTEPDFTAASGEFLFGSLGGRGFLDRRTGQYYDVIVASATITAESPATVPEPGTAIGLSGVVLGWLLTRKSHPLKVTSARRQKV